MSSKIETICQEKIVPLILPLGYEVIEIDYSKKVDGMNLTFTIYSKSGITLSDCEKVHKLVSEKLDEYNPTDDAAYILNVESEGLDRPIKSRADFERHKGQEYEVKLYAPMNKKKSFIGLLTDYDDKQVTLLIDQKPVVFEKEQVAHISPVLKF